MNRNIYIHGNIVIAIDQDTAQEVGAVNLGGNSPSHSQEFIDAKARQVKEWAIWLKKPVPTITRWNSAD